MTPGTLYRFGGWSLCIGAAIFILTNTAGSIAYMLSLEQTSPLWIAVQIVSIVAALLFSFGLPVVYLYQARETRVIGLLGFVITEAANVLGNIGYSLVITIVSSTLSEDILKQDKALTSGLYILSTLSSLLLFVGTCLFGLAIRNGNVFPRNAGLILLIASVAVLAEASPLPAFGVTVGLLSQICTYGVFIWLGSIVIRHSRLLDIERESYEPDEPASPEEIAQ